MTTKHVYQAIASITAAMATDGIGKNRKNDQQGYKFRGIDDVYNALSRELANNKLCIMPRVIERICVERTNAKGTALFYVTCKVDFVFVSAVDSSEHTVTTYGEAMDSGDKATNKAMSAAYKYAAMQTFCIPTEGDNDADASTHEVQARREEVRKPDIHPTSGVVEGIKPQQMKKLEDIASEARRMLMEGMDIGAAAMIDAQALPTEEKTALWTLMDSKERSALKKAWTEIKATKEAA